jgi:hypothetical protein
VTINTASGTITASVIQVVPTDTTNDGYNGGQGLTITFLSDAEINNAFELASYVQGGTTTASRGLGDENTVLAYATAGLVVLTLPLASSVSPEKTYWITKIDATANAVRVAASGSDTINGGATVQTTTQYGAFRIRQFNTNWWSY